MRLWHEKRGEVEPEDLSGDLVVQLGAATEELNRRWFERNTDQAVVDVQRRVQHPVLRDGWRQRSTAWSRTPGRYLRPSSCCPGRSRKRWRPKSTWPSCSTICG